MLQELKTWPIAKFSYAFIWKNKWPFFVQTIILSLMLYFSSFVVQNFSDSKDVRLGLQLFRISVIFITYALINFNLISSILLKEPLSYNIFNNLFIKPFWDWFLRIVLYFIVTTITFVIICIPFGFVFENSNMSNTVNVLAGIFFICCLIVWFNFYLRIMYFTMSKIDPTHPIQNQKIRSLKNVAGPTFRVTTLNPVLLLPITCVIVGVISSIFYTGDYIFKNSTFTMFDMNDLGQMVMTVSAVIGLARYVAVRRDYEMQNALVDQNTPVPLNVTR